MPKVQDISSPWFGCSDTPITPAMDVQLDQIVIRDVLNPLKETLLKRLEETINRKDPRDWFDCYLTFFILLNHAERAADHLKRFTTRNGIPVGWCILIAPLTVYTC